MSQYKSSPLNTEYSETSLSQSPFKPSKRSSQNVLFCMHYLLTILSTYKAHSCQFMLSHVFMMQFFNTRISIKHDVNLLSKQHFKWSYLCTPERKRLFKDTTNKDCTYSCSLIMLPEIQYM
jgi:hypothetical protein